MRVTILHSEIDRSATQDEQETWIQVASVYEALTALGHRVERMPFTLNFPEVVRELHRQQPTVVFNLAETIEGRVEQAHLAPMLLDQLNIPYTGANANSIHLTTDKLLAKQWLCAGQLKTPTWLDAKELFNISFPEDGPYIVKSVTEDGSIGIDQDSVVNDLRALHDVVNDRQKRFGGRWFAERFVHGREFNVAILPGKKGPEVLSIAEIKFQQMPKDKLHIVDYQAKWDTESEVYTATQRSLEFSKNDASLLASLKKLSIACWSWFKIIGHGRVDFRVDEEGGIWILEINTNPSIAPDAGFIAQAKQSGWEYVALIEHLLSHALEKNGI